jgi:hypothetical protein
MSADAATTDTLTDRDLLAAIRDHLDVPDAVTPDGYDKRYDLRSRRTSHVLGALDSVLAGSAEPADAIWALKRAAESTPIDYPTGGDCGKGCNAPSDGVHDSCPGPHAGTPVEAVR